jgi:hypothetical protein
MNPHLSERRDQGQVVASFLLEGEIMCPCAQYWYAGLPQAEDFYIVQYL